jgi:hypothetical protein
MFKSQAERSLKGESYKGGVHNTIKIQSIAFKIVASTVRRNKQRPNKSGKFIKLPVLAVKNLKLLYKQPFANRWMGYNKKYLYYFVYSCYVLDLFC